MNRIITLAAATVVLGTALGGPTASTAAEAEPDSDGTGRLMLVLDSSGSMKETAGGGQTKIAAAKQALGEVVDGLPAQQSVGLRVYGAKVFSADDQGACTDSQRVVDIGTDNRDDLSSAIGDYKPYGETPIGYALQEAGKDLGDEGQRSIVLVSDGEPTCDPDPCKVAADLSEDGIDLRIDVVGLDVSGNAREQLQCIAEKGNGTYYDADDAKGLVDSLEISATRATRPFDLTGEPVTGTADAASAPKITNGQYLDKIPASGSVSYRIPRTKSGSTIHVGVTLKGVQGSVGNGVSIDLDVPDEDGSLTPCASGSGFDNGLGTRDPLLYGSASTWASEPDDPCNTSKEVVATLETTVGGDEIAGKPIEIAVYEEPPLADPSGRDLDPAPEQPTWTTLTPGPAKKVVAGTSIGNAPVVPDGTYSGDLNAGESQVFAIPAGWGQDVQAQLDATINPEVTSAAGAGSDIEVRFIGPVRDGSQVPFLGDEPSDWEDEALANLRDRTDFRTGAQTQRISYLNRGDSDEDVTGGSIAGLRYVQVAYNVSREGPNLPYTLTLKTNGTAGDGAPKYQDVEGLVAPEADSRLVDARPTEGGDESAATGDRAAASSGSDDGGFPVLPVALGAAGLVALAAAALVVLRTTRRRST